MLKQNALIGALVSALLSAVLFVACAGQEDKKPAQAAAPQPEAPKAEVAKAATSCNTDNDCGSKQLCVRAQCVDITDQLAECTEARVQFDYDSSEVKTEDRTLLDRVARCLRADQHMRVTIEGNADERGTEEYNLSLGQRRALAVEKYLGLQGVSRNQLKAISYGKEKPVCREHNEACWAQNRRAALNKGAVAAGR